MASSSSSVLDIRNLTRREQSSDVRIAEVDDRNVDSKRAIAHERLRGNHIAMMEMLQQLTDENAMLRSMGQQHQATGGVPKSGMLADECSVGEVAVEGCDDVLFKKIEAQSEEIKDLKMRLGAADDDKKALKKQMNLARQEEFESRKKDKADIKTKTEESELLNRQTNEAVAKTQSLQFSVDILTTEIAQLKAKNVIMLQNTASIEEKNHALAKRNAELEAEVEAIDADNDVLIAKAAELQGQVELLASAQASVDDAMASQLRQMQEAHDELAAGKQVLMATISALSTELSSAASDNGRLRDAVTELECEVQRLQTALETAPDSAPQSSFFLTMNREGVVRVGNAAPQEATDQSASAPASSPSPSTISPAAATAPAPGTADSSERESYCPGCQSSSKQFDQFVSLKKENRSLKLQLAHALCIPLNKLPSRK